MSLLNEEPTEITEAQKKASRIRHINLTIIKEITRVWNESNDLIWKDQDPQGVIDALGEDIDEILEIDEEILNLLSNILGGRKQSQLDSILAKKAQRK